MELRHYGAKLYGLLGGLDWNTAYFVYFQQSVGKKACNLYNARDSLTESHFRQVTLSIILQRYDDIKKLRKKVLSH